MYVIIKIKGKQYKVSEGDIIDVDLLEQEIGSTVEFSDVLFVGDAESNNAIGSPLVAGYTVKGELQEVTYGPKVISMKYKKRKNYHRKKGHRQRYHRIKITAIAA